MKGAKLDGWGKNKTNWDNTISPKDIFEVANRILRMNGKLILFSQQPYTTELISNAITNLPHSYNMIWEKDHFANSLIAKKAPVSYYEDILVFSKMYDLEGLHPLRAYFRDIINYIGLKLGEINKVLGHRSAEHTFYINSTQYSLCKEDVYEELVRVFRIDLMQEFKTYDELRDIDKKYDSIFNLWEGNKHKVISFLIRRIMKDCIQHKNQYYR